LMLLDLNSARSGKGFTSSTALDNLDSLLACIDGYTVAIYSFKIQDIEWESFVRFLSDRLGARGSRGWEEELKSAAQTRSRPAVDLFLAELQAFEELQRPTS
jgi:hypothetical protein